MTLTREELALILKLAGRLYKGNKRDFERAVKKLLDKIEKEVS
jgi:hypothetical protein